MFLEIVTPEAVVFSSEVTSVAVPGINGEFQLLNNHAPIVSLLAFGMIKAETLDEVKIEEKFQDKLDKVNDRKLEFRINSGTLEIKENKIIILVD